MNTTTPLLPQLSLRGNQLTCDGQVVSLDGKRLTISLVGMFLQREDRRLGRDDIIRQIYGLNPERLSKSFLQSRRGSVLKLLARSREVIAAGLKGSIGEGIEWFAYHAETKTYELYRLHVPYLLAKQRGAISWPQSMAV